MQHDAEGQKRSAGLCVPGGLRRFPGSQRVPGGAAGPGAVLAPAAPPSEELSPGGGSGSPPLETTASLVFPLQSQPWSQQPRPGVRWGQALLQPRSGKDHLKHPALLGEPPGEEGWEREVLRDRQERWGGSLMLLAPILASVQGGCLNNEIYLNCRF